MSGELLWGTVLGQLRLLLRVLAGRLSILPRLLVRIPHVRWRHHELRRLRQGHKRAAWNVPLVRCGDIQRLGTRDVGEQRGVHDMLRNMRLRVAVHQQRVHVDPEHRLLSLLRRLLLQRSDVGPVLACVFQRQPVRELSVHLHPGRGLQRMSDRILLQRRDVLHVPDLLLQRGAVHKRHVLELAKRGVLDVPRRLFLQRRDAVTVLHRVRKHLPVHQRHVLRLARHGVLRVSRRKLLQRRDGNRVLRVVRHAVTVRI